MGFFAKCQNNAIFQALKNTNNVFKKLLTVWVTNLHIRNCFFGTVEIIAKTRQTQVLQCLIIWYFLVT